MRFLAVAAPALVLALPLLTPRDIDALWGPQLPPPALSSASTTFFLAEPTSSAPRTRSTTTHLSSSSPPTPTPTPVTHVPPTTSALQVPVSAPSSGLPEPLPTSPEEATQWKVIGIGIITVGLIATVILSIIFFDSWWNFICDLLCGKTRRRSKGEENMIPDWERRDWEFKLANEDGHRYPTMTSLTDIADHKQTPLTPAHIPDFDPQFLVPLSRRPSTR
ncbi:hypothetical protein AGABI2DRAFT_113898 [Agaricus bisporus var. bisporus H97]|uniref:hypothetical protein n=1 Tax=Agaricus bisporus var. bisporus (strain H97 / ATCC MYA-4626 / FGSC 10389) TaxID=936046 RepID=UPI00029F77E7|nr:hypothetical protein AGABI2DRAFT_113898 [Agaricus bisporus var. bisporus H97]EKV51156.1 hypothetical protein AGABI2DRAFT_113898 [Agaricus bisporus var. bisporus H97]